MKVNFHPRSFTRNNNGPNQPDPPHLRHENPALSRTVDTACVALIFAKNFDPPHLAMRAANGALAVGATVWGANKLFGGETVLDRLEGVGNLALAGHAGMEAGGYEYPAVSGALSLIHSAGELIIGASDLIRGRDEHNGRRATAGLLQGLVGAAGITGQLCPPAAAVASGIALAAQLGRQVAIQ